MSLCLGAVAPSCAGLHARGIDWRYLDVLYFRSQGGQTWGGMTSIRTTVALNEERRVRVGILEEHVEAAGKQWRGSVWLAAFLAARTLGVPMTRYRFNVSASGFIDGPSAGGLIAVGFMAAIRGDPVRRDVTMTGALTPDGSIAPVDGLPRKIAAAARCGRKVVGIPAGQISARMNGRRVDLRAYGRSLGIEVREVRDLHDAYELLTGRRLDRPPRLPRDRMVLPARLAVLLRARVRKLVSRVRGKLKRLGTSGGRQAQRLGSRASKALADAVRYLQRQYLGAAYVRAARAAALARAAVNLSPPGGDVVEQALLAKAQAAVHALDVDLALRSRKAGTPALGLLAAYSGAARARGDLKVARALLKKGSLGDEYQGFGAREIRKLRAEATRFAAALFRSFARLEVELARDALRFPSPDGSGLSFDPVALDAEARAFASAATANVHYMTALFLADVAADLEQPVEVVQRSFGLSEPSYLLAAELADLAVSRAHLPATISSSLLLLAAGVHSFLESALVIAKYQSVAASLPGKPTVRSLRRSTALQALLRNAERSAREAAATALARIGTVPAEALLHYHEGASLSAGTFGERLRALGAFWRSRIVSEVASRVLRRR